MEIAILFSIVVFLACLALDFGADSRPSEHEHARDW
jgi:hypothetical protein